MRVLHTGKRHLSSHGTLPVDKQDALAATAASRHHPAPRPKGVPVTQPVGQPPVSVNATYDQVAIGNKYVLVTESPSVTPTRCVEIAAAMSKQVNEHFAQPAPNGYAMGANVRAATAELPAQPDENVVLYTDKVDQEGALAYHDRTATGKLVIKVFPALDLQDGVDPSSSTSHEILEAEGDPELNSCVQDPATGKIWAAEVCDAVEDDSYTIDGVQVSNFTLPLYWSPLDGGLPAGAKYDYLGLCKEPFEIRPGGYGQYWDGQKWAMVQKDAVGVPSSASSPNTSRRRARKLLMGRAARRGLRFSRITRPSSAKAVDVIRELLALGYQL
jgi:hypothetical protein